MTASACPPCSAAQTVDTRPISVAWRDYLRDLWRQQ